MKKNNTIEQEINEIRLSIYEETKDMSLDERVEYTRKMAEPVIRRYGLKVIPKAGNSVSIP